MDTQLLNEALIRQFPSPPSDVELLDQQNILSLLFELQCNGINGDSVLTALANKNLSQHDHAILAFLDTYLLTTITSAQLPATISNKLKGVVVAAMRIALSDGMLAMTKGPVIPIADSLLALTFGWSDLRGKSPGTLEKNSLELCKACTLQQALLFQIREWSMQEIVCSNCLKLTLSTFRPMKETKPKNSNNDWRMPS